MTIDDCKKPAKFTFCPKNPVTNPENHKGQFCDKKRTILFCQEGYCSECEQNKGVKK